MIKNVIFDVGNVIFNFDINEALDKFTDNDEDKDFIKSNVYNSPEWNGFGLIDLGYINLEEAASQIKDRTNHSNDELVDSFLENYVSYGFVDERVTNLLLKLKENGYKVYVLSNISDEVLNRLNLRGFLDKIDGYVLSYEYHQIKPYISIYKTLLNKYNINPEESLFVDDRKENIDTANSLGIKGYNVTKNNYDSIIELLSEYNVVR